MQQYHSTTAKLKAIWNTRHLSQWTTGYTFVIFSINLRIAMRNIVHMHHHKTRNLKSRECEVFELRTHWEGYFPPNQNSSPKASLLFLRQRIYASLSVQHSCDTEICVTHFIYTRLYILTLMLLMLIQYGIRIIWCTNNTCSTIGGLPLT